MKKKIKEALCLLTLLCAAHGSAQPLPENPGRPAFAPTSGASTEMLVPKITAVTGLATDSQAFKFVESADKMVVEGRFGEAKEAYRTALRIEPMNLSLWAAYDDSVVSDFVARKRNEKSNPVIERDISPTFAINRIDSYMELGTLYVVGTVQNLSRSLKQKIQLTARILDENKRELRSETGTLRSFDKGLLPNESSLFEIPFKQPPPGAHSFRVEVTAWE